MADTTPTAAPGRIPGFFWYVRSSNAAHPITAREADRYYRESDAGIDDEFVVRARCVCAALRGAREWVAVRADDSESTMPDHLSLDEREWRPGKSYMSLWVNDECCGKRAA